MFNTATYPALVVRRPLIALLCLAAVILVACETESESRDSPLQTDQDVTPDAAAETVTENEDDVFAPTPVAIEAQLGDEVVVTGAIARQLSNQVITLEGVYFEPEPAEEVVVILPTSLEESDEEFAEGTLVAVTGKVIRVTDEGLHNIEPEIFQEHRDVLEGFRAQLGILATDVRVAEETAGD